MTFTSFFNLVVGRKLGLRGMRLASESINSTSFGDVPHLLRMIITFTLTVESIGAVLLPLFCPCVMVCKTLDFSLSGSICLLQRRI